MTIHVILKRATFVISKKNFNAKNHPMGENSPNLATLMAKPQSDGGERLKTIKSSFQDQLCDNRNKYTRLSEKFLHCI
jgi:hypothetical protein